MSLFTVYYCPKISKEAQIKVAEYVTPSMMSIDNDSKQYEVSSCIENLRDLNLNSDVDILIDLEVAFIELPNCIY